MKGVFMKRIATGILAHVDAGKTTLSEGLLYCAGEIRKLGRVDNKDAFLDTDELEKKRGITIFSKQAILNLGNSIITLIDTPGHIDFSAEAERTLQILDYAILVISASDGVQSHTTTLWNMLKNNNIPTFIFINKLDLSATDKDAVISDLKDSFKCNFIDFNEKDKNVLNENIAVCDEAIMNYYLENGSIDTSLISNAIRKRNIFPVFGGSALKMDGIEEFLTNLEHLSLPQDNYEDFGAKVFKITTDENGQRLTFMKVTGGHLKVKATINGEKINEIRVYSGNKYTSTLIAECGCVCAVTGLKNTFAGQGLGFEINSDILTSQPIFNYKVILPKGCDISTALENLKQLQQEETLLNVIWNEHLKEIQIQIMGEIQLEVLKQLILKRFNINVEFSTGNIVYKETITNISEGVGHYEPLRHYAEVHLLLEPLKRGEGLHFETDCSEDELDKNWQRLILTHLMEKTHYGVLTGSPITDIKITLKSGKAHLKHTEGGDFRQATYRAVRHGLRCAESVLLEPYYDFTMEIPSENTGRAMTDLNKMDADFSLPQTYGSTTIITGNAPANSLHGYHKELIAYTHGKGKINCSFSGYDVCKNPTAVIEAIDYNFDGDTDNTADSVFCSHGTGFTVKWNEVKDYMHLPSVLNVKKEEKIQVTKEKVNKITASDDELLEIFERTYGKIERKIPVQNFHTQKEHIYVYKPQKSDNRKEYLLIDGYNIIFSWNDLKNLAEENLENARQALIEKICTYKLFKPFEIILVFDAYKVKGNIGDKEFINGINVVYTKESQTADAYIEKTTKELEKNYRVTVATSDGLEQLIIFGSGANRMSARHLEDDINKIQESIRVIVDKYNLETTTSKIYNILQEKLSQISIIEDDDND